MSDATDPALCFAVVADSHFHLEGQDPQAQVGATHEVWIDSERRIHPCTTQTPVLLGAPAKKG